MNNQSDKELLNELGLKVERKIKAQFTTEEERIVFGLEEIQNFYEKEKRLPNNQEDKEIFERLFAVRLNRLNKLFELEEYKELLENFDHQKLLNKNLINKQQINEVELDDSNLLSELGLSNTEKDIRKLIHVRSSQDRKIIEEFANREKCENFEKFKPFFDNVQKDLKSGIRKSIPLKERPEIKKGLFFILNGQKTYVANIGEIFMQEYGISDARLYLVFDNGTESKMLMRSLQRALTIDKSSRIISDPNMGPLFSNTIDSEDHFTGNIYILRSKSNLPYIIENRNIIHKIGFTTSTIQKRISNAKSDPTFLMADVEIVDSYKLFNIKSSRFENLVQKIFSNTKLDIEIIDRFGKPIKPEEWFLVPLEVIKEAIQKIIDGSIIKYFYDPLKAKLIERDNENLN